MNACLFIYRLKEKERYRNSHSYCQKIRKFCFAVMPHAFRKDAKYVMIAWDNLKWTNQATSWPV